MATIMSIAVGQKPVSLFPRENRVGEFTNMMASIILGADRKEMWIVMGHPHYRRVVDALIKTYPHTLCVKAMAERCRPYRHVHMPGDLSYGRTILQQLATVCEQYGYSVPFD